MKISRRIKKMIASMTLQEKAAQLTQCNAQAINAETRAKLTGDNVRFDYEDGIRYSVGSVLNYDCCARGEIQARYLKKSKNKIPLTFMLDVVHGYATVFPVPLAMGCTFSTELVEACAEASAREARAAGSDVTFSPMVDLVRDCRWGRVMETTGEDHFLNGEMGKAFIRGYHKGGMAVCVKHFAAYGAAQAGRDYNTTDLSEYCLHEYYYHAYRECMKEKPEMVMSSFNLLNGKPVNARKELLVDLLRKKWGFDGVLISDYAGVEEMLAHGFAENNKECARIALESEIDIEMTSTNYIDYLPELVREGTISEKHVDKMLARVLQLKERLGVLDNPDGGLDIPLYRQLLRSEESKALVRKAAEKSFVLLKNQAVLPLKRADKVALIGALADERAILGQWVPTNQIENTATVRERLCAFLGTDVPYAKGVENSLCSTDEGGFAEAEKIASDAEKIVVCLGEPYTASGESASRANPDLPSVQLALLKRLKGLNKPIIGVIFAGRPLILTEAEKYLDGILYAWFPGSEGANAVVNTLYGLNNPSGKLTMSFPRSVGQCPIHYNEFHTGRRKGEDIVTWSPSFNSAYLDEYNSPLYPFGYGMSYTRFEIEDLQLSSSKMRLDERVVISANVKNCGDCDGEEVVQLYIRDKSASFVRPIKELKGFEKIFLKVGQEKRVFFTVDRELLSFYNDKGERLCERGEFILMLGNGSENLLCAEITVE